jgi:hypothetical protein
MVPLALIEMIQKMRCIICTVSFRQEITVNNAKKTKTLLHIFVEYGHMSRRIFGKLSHPFLKRGQNYVFAAPLPGGGVKKKLKS